MVALKYCRGRAINRRAEAARPTRPSRDGFEYWPTFVFIALQARIQHTRRWRTIVWLVEVNNAVNETVLFRVLLIVKPDRSAGVRETEVEQTLQIFRCAQWMLQPAAANRSGEIKVLHVDAEVVQRRAQPASSAMRDVRAARRRRVLARKRY